MPDGALWRKLRQPHVWRRVMLERIGEPLHLHALTALVAAFGGARAKIDFDLVPRPHLAACILRAADNAAARGVRELTLVELGVASGAGLLNMCELAARVTAITGVAFRVFGFDGGEGMPPALDWRDHPELYREGDYAMGDRAALERALPENARLWIGPLEETIPAALREVGPRAPIGFASIDLDYYSSTKTALRLFTDAPTKYLPTTLLYLDDVWAEQHNRWAGELLAVREFSDEHALRKIEPYTQLRHARVHKAARWLDQVWVLHVFDHPERETVWPRRDRPLVSDNPYLDR